MRPKEAGGDAWGQHMAGGQIVTLPPGVMLEYLLAGPRRYRFAVDYDAAGRIASFVIMADTLTQRIVMFPMEVVAELAACMEDDGQRVLNNWHRMWQAEQQGQGGHA